MASVKDITSENSQTKTYILEFTEKHKHKNFTWEPGQFMMLSLFGVGEAALSISNIPENGPISTTIRAVGNVTQKIKELKKGDTLGLRGPYGTGWPIKEAKKKNVLLIAGGMGLAPLRGVIEHISQKRNNFGQLEILYGARTPNDMIFTNQFQKWHQIEKSRLDLTVDGIPPGVQWDGKIGLVTSCFPSMKTRPQNSVALVCGPEIMMRFVAKCLETIGFKDSQVFLSLERRMKCGIGKCGHCQLGPKYVCKDGPVFSYQDIKPYIDPL
jgi:NAD(P)H-flavin reductase